jgi:ankyrin repeat protein
MAVVRTLIGQRFDVNVSELDGTTPLHWRVERDEKELVSLLIGAGAHATVVSDYGMTPLSLACRNGNAAIIRVLKLRPIRT